MSEWQDISTALAVVVWVASLGCAYLAGALSVSRLHIKDLRDGADWTHRHTAEWVKLMNDFAEAVKGRNDPPTPLGGK